MTDSSISDSTSSPGFGRVFAALLSLTTLAFAQSVYQAVSGNAEFVVLNQISHADLFLIIFCFNLLPAAVLAICWQLIRGWNDQVATYFLSAAFLLLLTPFLFELHKTFLSPRLKFSHNTILLAVPLAIAAVIVFRYRNEFERFLLILTPVIVLFPALFLWHAWKEVATTAARPPTIAFRTTAVEPKSLAHPPVFLILLDEFTRPALLDASGHIDATRFPHFAALAGQSTWFTNATANAEYTTRSIPVIVTGNFPHANDASDAAYPDNLFRLLSPTYDVTIHEEVTRFCVDGVYHCPDAERVRQRDHLLWAVFELYLLRVAPKSVVVRIEANGLLLEQQRWREFLGEIGNSPGGKPPLEFMHLELPHAPYMLTPDGAIHETSPAGFDAKFAGDTELLQRLRGDYEMQIEYVDRELGTFLDKLKQAGIYDKSLIIVTSDHGVSWNSAAPGRVLTDANAEMIFPVPLFIKLPGQEDARTSAEDVQSIDLVPTIGAAVGVEVPWLVAGRDIFAPVAAPRQKIMVDANGRKFAYPPTFAETVPADVAR